MKRSHPKWLNSLKLHYYHPGRKRVIELLSGNTMTVSGGSLCGGNAIRYALFPEQVTCKRCLHFLKETPC